MSSGGAFGGARGFSTKAPEKGVFPLDHFGECKQVLAFTTSGSVLCSVVLPSMVCHHAWPQLEPTE